VKGHSDDTVVGLFRLFSAVAATWASSSNRR